MACEMNSFIDSLPSKLEQVTNAYDAFLKIKEDLKKNIFHPMFSDFVEYGGDDDEIREAILASDFLNDFERTVCQQINFYQGWVDHMDPEPTLYFKRKQRVAKSVKFAELPARTGLNLPQKAPKKPNPHRKPAQLLWYKEATWNLNPRAIQ
jgi:hypothetical protein